MRRQTRGGIRPRTEYAARESLATGVARSWVDPRSGRVFRVIFVYLDELANVLDDTDALEFIIVVAAGEG